MFKANSKKDHLKIFVTDDETMLFYIKTIFQKKEAYRVITTQSTWEAMKIAQESNPEFLIIDSLVSFLDGNGSKLKADKRLNFVHIIILDDLMNMKKLYPLN